MRGGPHVATIAERLLGRDRVRRWSGPEGHFGQLGGIRGSHGRLPFPRRVDQSVVVLEVLRGRVIRLIGHPGGPPLAVREVPDLEFLDSRENPFRRRLDRPATHATLVTPW